MILVESPGTVNRHYFLFYGLAAGCVLSAQGILIGWRTRPPPSAPRAAGCRAFALASVVAVAALMAAPGTLDVFQRPASRGLFEFGQATGRNVSVLVRRPGCDSCGSVHSITALGPPREVGCCRIGERCASRGGYGQHAVNKLKNAIDRPDEPVVSGRRLTPNLYEALKFIRARSSPDAVIAVNNAEALEFSYAAFAERRVFSWVAGDTLSARARTNTRAWFREFLLGVSRQGRAGPVLQPRRAERRCVHAREPQRSETHGP